MATVYPTQTGVRIVVPGQGIPGPPGAPGAGGNVEDLSTAGALGTVPTSDGAGGLDMLVPSGAGNVVSPGGEIAGRITKFVGSNSIEQTPHTETELGTAITHSGVVVGNPHNLDAIDVAAEPAGSITTHAANEDAHHPQVHTVASHVDTIATGAQLNTLTAGPASDADALHTHPGIVGGGPGSDTTAIHVDVAGEIAGIAQKITLTGTEHVAIEDTADLNNKKRALTAAIAASGPPAAHTIASHSDTTATGAELDVLTGGADASTLHLHTHASITGKGTDDHHPQVHTIVSHDTTATGAQLNTLTGGPASNADALHTHPAITPGGAGTDTTAIHVDVADELTPMTEKVTPLSGDFIYLESTADLGAPRKVQLGNLFGNVNSPGGEIAGNIAKFTGSNAIDEIAVTETQLVTLTAGPASDASALHFHPLTGQEILETGLITGGAVTINADPAKFDVAAGTGTIVDWTVPDPPTRTEVSFGPFTAVVVDNLSLSFTGLYITTAGTLQQNSGQITTPEQWRQLIPLQAIIHPNGVSITSVSTFKKFGFQSTFALMDWSLAIGAKNLGNTAAPAATNLTVKKNAGTTTLPFVNGSVDNQNTSISAGAEISPLPNLLYSFRDGLGGYVFDPAPTVLLVNLFDDNNVAGLQPVQNNRWTNIRVFYDPSSNTLTFVPGQVEYISRAEAQAAIFVATVDINPLLGNLVFVSVITVQEGTIDLTDAATVSFLDVVSATTGGGGGAVTQTYIGLLDTSDSGYVGLAGRVPLVDIGETGLDLTQLDHNVHLAGIGVDDHHPQLHTIASHSDTTATGSELETLTDGSNADLLHTHAGIGSEFVDNLFRIQDNVDVTKKIAFEASTITTGTVRTITVPDANITIDDIGDPRTPAAHTIASHSDTTATGAELETLTDGSNADLLHTHAGIGSEFADNLFRVQDNLDATKQIAFEASTITTATTRTITVPDKDLTLDDIADTRTPAAHTIASHSDTTATGAELETLTDGSNADVLHLHTDFTDSTFRIQDNVDATKEIAFQASTITTATVRTITMPDKNLTLDDIADTRTPSAHTLTSHSDVNITTPVDGDVLTYDFAAGEWQNSQPPNSIASVTLAITGGFAVGAQKTRTWTSPFNATYVRGSAQFGDVTATGTFTFQPRRSTGLPSAFADLGVVVSVTVGNHNGETATQSISLVKGDIFTFDVDVIGTITGSPPVTDVMLTLHFTGITVP